MKVVKEKDRLKMSDLLRQRTALESELNIIKTDAFGRNKETNTFKTKIENLKKELADQKRKNISQQKEVEKFKNLYISAKSNVTPFSDSRVDNKTDITKEVIKTPTDVKLNTFDNKGDKSDGDSPEKEIGSKKDREDGNIKEVGSKLVALVGGNREEDVIYPDIKPNKGIIPTPVEKPGEIKSLETPRSKENMDVLKSREDSVRLSYPEEENTEKKENDEIIF